MSVKKSFLTVSLPSCLPSAYVYTSGGCGQSVTVAFVPNSLKVGVVFLLGSTLMAGDSLGPDHGSMTFGKKSIWNYMSSIITCLLLL